MLSRRSFIACAALVAAGTPLLAHAQTLPPGGAVLTEQEREQFRARLRDAQSEEERQQIRNEYSETVRARAQQRGQGADQSGGQGQGGSGQQGQPQQLMPQKGKKGQ